MSKSTLKILPIGGVVFPYQNIKLLIPPNSSFFGKNLIGSFLGVCFHKDKLRKNATQANLTDYGIAVKITHEIVENGSLGETAKMVGGVTLRRFKIKRFLNNTPPYSADVELFSNDIPLERENMLHNDGTVSKLKELAFRYVDIITESDVKTKARTDYIRSESNLLKLHFTIASYMKVSDEEKYQLLEINEIEDRIKKIIQMLEEQIKLTETKGELKQKTRESIQREVRKQYLKKQFQDINKDSLGPGTDEIAQLEEKLNNAKLPEEIYEKIMQELNRLKQTGARDPDYNVQRKYLETILDLPWGKSSNEISDINYAEKILNQEHAGLEKIKKRILEFLAVKILKKDSKGSILCFQGPPGVGKTSLGKSIAHALGRKFERVALGGVRDEAEIRGHRRTYVGAMPGVFIEALLRCKTNNPVILLDEIDKIGRNSFQGDPSSALLEVLDPNQNHTFKDHYIGVPFDLSNVLFIATANTLETIQAPLLDRMEIISLAGYTLQEKTEIAQNYLIPKQVLENGLKKDLIEFSEESIHHIINYYTREAGVRNLERTIGSICRKVAFDYLKTQQSATSKEKKHSNFKMVWVSETFIEEVLGPKAFDDDLSDQIDQPGIAIGMAWTQVGGKTLLVEASRAMGKGKLEITGKLGDVMKESVSTALGWIKSNQDLILSLSIQRSAKPTTLIDPKKGLELDQYDINIHFPAAAIPKDGPSAGITIAIALISLFTGIKVRHDVSMTGEISLKGSVLPVGGIKEKCLAAYAAGIKKIILPDKNKKDIEEISKEVRKNIKFYFVKHISDVIRIALDLPIEEVESIIKLNTSNANKLSKL